MSRPPADAAALALALDRNGDEPLAAQMTRQLRALILGGRLRDRARLPSSRTLAIDLGVSRATIVEAFEQLASEGFVEGRRGAGVFVSPGLVGAAERRAASAPSPAARRPVAIRPFELGAVDPDLAPFGEFSKLLRNHWRRPSPARSRSRPKMPLEDGPTLSSETGIPTRGPARKWKQISTPFTDVICHLLQPKRLNANA